MKRIQSGFETLFSAIRIWTDCCFCFVLRTSVDQESGPPAELLEPVNLHLNIKRNLAASWYKKMVAVEVIGDLKPMKV